MDYIIVQAGGKGTRLEHLTINKPKALVPVQNLPMLFHLFKKYPDKRFIIIGDYQYDVLKKYLQIFSNVIYQMVDARGEKGTCAGLSKALHYIPDNESFMLIWSDLILPESFKLPKEEDKNYIGLSGDFPCRWKYENNVFIEEQSIKYGVAGCFIFKNKEQISDVPKEGEFVKWLGKKDLKFETLSLCHTKEYGLISEYQKLATEKCRPFNRLTVIEGNKVLKEGIDKQGMALAIREKNWYQTVGTLGFKAIPKIDSYDPFVMEKIEGKNIFEYQLEYQEKKAILEKIVQTLKKLHSLGRSSTDYFSMKEAYFTKTIERLNKVRDLIPFVNQKEIIINGRTCKNIFFYQDLLEEKVKALDCQLFVLLHGDCTFSNMMLRDQTKEPVLIDPRGYFGYTKLYGHVAYDWAKLYYSIVGNYDQFNQKKFRLFIEEKEIQLKIESNGWEDLEEVYLKLISEDVSSYELKLIHAIIWLSLTTYAWEDYDSICGAFYNGLYYLEEVL